MTEQITSASGVQYGLKITNSGAALTTEQQTSPLDDSKNNPAWKFEYIISGTSTGAIGSTIGSVIQFVGTGSFVNVLTYSAGLLTNVGSYS